MSENTHREPSNGDWLAEDAAGQVAPAKVVTRSTLPAKDWADLAEELLQRYPGVDRAVLLKRLLARTFFNLRFGNKREERAACDLLNDVQEIAAKLQEAQP